MKKLLTILLSLAVMSTSVFAIGITVDGNFAVPLAVYTDSSGTHANDKNWVDIKSTSNELGFGGDVGVTVALSKYLGVKADLGFFLPQSLSTKTTTKTCILGNVSTTTTDNKAKYSDYYDSLTAFNIFVGPAFTVLTKKKYDVTVVPGFSIDMRSATIKTGDTKKVSKSTTLGFGAELEATYKINKNIYANFSCPLVYQFKVTDGDGNSKDITHFAFTPMIGLGYKF